MNIPHNNKKVGALQNSQSTSQIPAFALEGSHQTTSASTCMAAAQHLYLLSTIHEHVTGKNTTYCRAHDFKKILYLEHEIISDYIYTRLAYQ